MKKTFIFAVVAMLASFSASAQYFCTQQGAKFTYTETAVEDNKEKSETYTSEVVSVTDKDGVISMKQEDIHVNPENPLQEMRSATSFVYNPATKTTSYIMMTAQDQVDGIMKMFELMAQQHGQTISTEQREQILRNITATGQIGFDIPDEIANGTAIPKSRIKMTVESSSMSINLWEGKFVGAEDVETPAGLFPGCQKVTYVLKQNMPEQNDKFYVTQWFAKGYGPVKTVLADKNGKAQETTVLQSK